MPRMCLISNLEFTALPTTSAARQRILDAPPQSTSCNENEDPPPFTATSCMKTTTNNNNNNGSSEDEYETCNNNIDLSSSSSSSGFNNDDKLLFNGDHDDGCYICDEGGELICCDYCAKVYHFDCHIPVVNVDSIDDTTLWRCMNCCGSRSRTYTANDCNNNNNNDYNHSNNNHSTANKIIVLDTSNDDDDNVVKYHKSPTKRQKLIHDDDYAAADNDENEKKIHNDNDKVGDNNHGIIPMAQDVTQTNQYNDVSEIVIDGVVIKDVQRPTIDNSNYNNNSSSSSNNKNNIENGIVHKNYKANERNNTEIAHNNDDDDVVVIDSKEDRVTAQANLHIANNSNEPPKKTTNHQQIILPVQSTACSSNKTGNNKTTQVSNTNGSTVGKKTNKTTSHHNHNQSKPFTGGLPVRERFSEYQIDNASSITELESIRRRLLTLLDRTENRLQGMRVAEALTGTFGKGNMEGLSMEELMAKLVGGVKESKDFETTSDKETCTHKGHIPVTCPLCFEKISSSQSSSLIVTCHICEVDGMCSNCHEQCTSCHLSTCADCLMSCDRCVSYYHCSDCMGIGHGKCVSCRKNSLKGLPTQNASKKQQGSKVKDKSTKNAVSSLSRGNQTLASWRNKQREHPPLNDQPLSMTREDMGTPHAMAQHQAAATIGSLSRNPSSVHNPSAMTIQRVQVAAASEPRATHPLVDSTTTIAPFHTTSTTVVERLFSVHRFHISDVGTIGLNISWLKSSKKCIISTVHPDSIAVNHGIEGGDEILPSRDNDDVYSCFISATKQRPLLFEVKRLYKHPGRLIIRSSGGAPVPHSLHRFIITTSGPLGIMIEKVDSMILLRNIAPMSVADIHGLQNDDILCISCKKGQLQQRSPLFVDAVKGGIRPMIIEVWRAVPPIAPTLAPTSAPLIF